MFMQVVFNAKAEFGKATRKNTCDKEKSCRTHNRSLLGVLLDSRTIYHDTKV